MWISDHQHVIMSLKEFHFDNRKERVRVMDNSLDTVDGITDDEMTAKFVACMVYRDYYLTCEIMRNCKVTLK